MILVEIVISWLPNHRSVSFLCLFLLLCQISVVFTGCEEKVKPSVSSTGLAFDVPTQESWNAVITFTDSGRITGILRAGHIAMYAERKVTKLDSGVHVDFYDEQQHHTSVLTSRQGLVHDLTHDFEAHENVVVVSDSGSTLRTEDLYWTNATQRVHTQAFVDIVSPTEHIQGQGFESDQGLKRYTIFKVTGQSRPNE